MGIFHDEFQYCLHACEGFLQFPPQSQHMGLRLFGDSKLHLSVSVFMICVACDGEHLSSVHSCLTAGVSSSTPTRLRLGISCGNRDNNLSFLMSGREIYSVNFFTFKLCEIETPLEGFLKGSLKEPVEGFFLSFIALLTLNQILQEKRKGALSMFKWTAFRHLLLSKPFFCSC